MTSKANKIKIDEHTRFADEMAKREPEAEVLKERFVYGDKTEKFEHNEFAKWIMEDSGEHFSTMPDTEEIFVYRDGIYIPRGNACINENLDSIMDGCLSTNRAKSEVKGHVRARTYTEREEYDSDHDVMNMNNGLYHIESDEFEPHTHKYMSLRKSAVNYDPNATCPTIDQYIKEVVAPHRVQTIYEMAGYALMTKKTLKRGFILVGHPDTGKSQMIKLFEAFVGEDAKCAVGPIELGKDSHAAAGLYGKMLCAVDDLGVTPIHETGNIKAVISEGTITRNEKNQVAFPFTPHVLVMWGCNQVPETDDPYIRDKFDILEFKNVFGGHKEPDRKLIEKMTTEEEMSGFFNKAITAIKVAKERGYFTGSLNTTEREKMWRFNSTPIAKFVNDCCSLDNDKAETPVSSFRKAYVKWAASKGINTEKKKEMNGYLSDIGIFRIKVTRRDSPLFGKWCYYGIDLLSSGEIQRRTSSNNNSDPKLENFLDQGQEPHLGGGDPTSISFADPLKKPDKYVHMVSNGEKVGSEGGISDETDSGRGQNIDPETNNVSGSEGGKHMHQSKRIDISDESIDIITHAFKKLTAKNPNLDGWSILEITGSCNGRLSSDAVGSILAQHTDALGVVRTNAGYKLVE